MPLKELPVINYESVETIISVQTGFILINRPAFLKYLLGNAKYNFYV